MSSTSTPPQASSPTCKRRTDETLHPVGEAAVEKVHAKGKLTARERVYALLDEGSFVELDALAKHRSTNFGLGDKRPLGDGVVTGYGTIDGREVCIFSQDATVFGGSLGEVYGEKIVKVQELAMKTGRPLIGINDGAGRPHPGGCGLAGPVQQDLPQQHPGLGGHPADLADHGCRRRRARVLPRADRLHRDGRPDQPDVHHRSRRDQDRHRRGRHPGGAGRRPHPHGQVRHRALCRLRRAGRLRVRARPAELPAAQQLRRPAASSRCRFPRARSRTTSPPPTSSSTR